MTCCDGIYLPNTIYATLTRLTSSCSCLDGLGSIPLTWDAALGLYHATVSVTCPNSPLEITYEINGDNCNRIGINCTGSGAPLQYGDPASTTLSCDPFLGESLFNQVYANEIT